MPRRPLDLARIKSDIRKHVGDGEKVKKLMRCGHEDLVFKSVNEATTECWVCRMGKQAGRAQSGPAE